MNFPGPSGISFLLSLLMTYNLRLRAEALFLFPAPLTQGLKPPPPKNRCQAQGKRVPQGLKPLMVQSSNVGAKAPTPKTSSGLKPFSLSAQLTRGLKPPPPKNRCQAGPSCLRARAWRYVAAALKGGTTKSTGKIACATTASRRRRFPPPCSGALRSLHRHQRELAHLARSTPAPSRLAAAIH